MVAAPDYSVAEALKKENLSQADYEEICRRLGRAPNRAELGMFGVMWSEHCCYRNSRPLLQGFPTTGPRILVGPGENAGVVDLGEGQRLAFKIESHNHPSAVEPFQGAATGVGGILRDIFTMGARPIALLNALRFGPLEDERNVGLMEGVVAGIAHYGNCVGVPTVGGEVAFDPSYSGNPLVNAMALGLMETEDIVCAGAEGVGYPVVYVGSTTGRDGMGGASFASAELTEASLDDRPAVQVGDPFLEKGLIEACLEAFQTGDVVAAQDMGAAGLTCSCSEMAAKGGLGIELDLDRVPAREAGMTPYEFLLSESQERMLFVVKPGREEALMQRFTRWGLQAAVVGRVLQENVVRVLQHGQVAAEVPASALADDTPINRHTLISEPPAQIQAHWRWSEDQLPAQPAFSWNEALLALLDDPTIASKRWVYRQYDHQVQANTVLPPGGGDAAVVRLRPQASTAAVSRGVAAVVDCPNRWVALDPERGGMAAVAEAARNLSCVGAEPLAVTDNLNFPSPETPTGYWQLAQACRGLSTACSALETPVTGGNVSLYNETRLPDGRMQPIHPTPVVGMVGLVHDLAHVRGQAWREPGDVIWLLGVPLDTTAADPRVSLAGSSYLERLHGAVTGRPPEIDLALERSVQGFLRRAITQGLVRSAHDLSDGGLAVAAAECCIASGLGAHLEIPASSQRPDRLLFAEGGARILVSVAPAHSAAWQQALDASGVPAQCLGVVEPGDSGASLVIHQAGAPLLELPVAQMAQRFEQAIPRRMGVDLPHGLMHNADTRAQVGSAVIDPQLTDRPDKPEEACGVFAVLASDQPVANLTYFGLYALQHRGQESAGIAVFEQGTGQAGGPKVRLHKDMGLVSQVFDQGVLERLPGQLAIGHNRYSTTGSSKACNAQPVLLNTRLGPLAFAHNGNLVNAAELRQAIASDIPEVEFTSTTDSELIAFAIQHAVNGGQGWDGAIRAAASRCRGAFSLVIGTPEGLFALRDGHGIRPLVFGHMGEADEAQWVVSSETCGLDIIGASFDGDVEPGEIIHFRLGDSTPQRSRWISEPAKLCVFEMIYFARPDSRFFGESLYSYRVRIGEVLARETPVEADIVIGVPDSGIPAAIGYSQWSGIPFGDGLIKNRYVGRTFIQPTQAMREAGIRVKLNPLPDVLAGKRVVVIDDSIVRGTTSRKLVAAIRDAGATEVHMRISSPPVTHPCFYGIDTDTQDQLIAARLTLEEIAAHLGVDSLAYLSKSGMVEAAQANAGHFCTACFDGAYPIAMDEAVSSSKLMLEPSGLAAQLTRS